MEISFLNSSFQTTYILDIFNSLIWTDRYWLCGDFDISTPPTEEVLTELITTKYLRLKESEHIMVLEDLNIHSDTEEGSSLILKGRSLESILDRRIVWNGTVLDGSLQDKIQLILNNNIISPSDPNRDITNFEFLASTDPKITDMTIKTQVVGASVYKFITDVCRSNELGFKVILTNSGNFQFQLYYGADRSYSQTINPYVVFSPDFDNLINSDYIETSKYLKTVALVAGEEGVGNTRTKVTVTAPGGGLTGLNRREMYFEANIVRHSPDGDLTEAQYLEQLNGKGKEELAKNISVKSFDGEVDVTMYKYNEDFYMGDILQIADAYGHETKSRVTEITYSQNVEGIKIYPTFTTVV